MPNLFKKFCPNNNGLLEVWISNKRRKIKNGDYQEININGKETKGDNFENYDPVKNDSTFWSSLMIITGHRQKMRYRG